MIWIQMDTSNGTGVEKEVDLENSKSCYLFCYLYRWVYTRKNAQVNAQLVNKFVAMLLFCQVVPGLWLTTCWQVVDLQPDNKLLEQTCNKAVEFIKLVASLLQACSNLSTSWEQAGNILSTSCCSRLARILLQVCYKLCVFTCIYI